MSIATSQSAAEAEIRELVDRYVQAIRASNVERIVSHYAPDLLAYDAIAQLQFALLKPFDKCGDLR